MKKIVLREKLLLGASVIEEKVEIVKEIAVIAARNRMGEIKCYPVVEMLFDPIANLVDKLICPASITVEQSEKAVSFASEIIELLNMEGLLAVEFFVDSKGDVIVNEVAPRPHNSGHYNVFMGYFIAGILGPISGGFLYDFSGSFFYAIILASFMSLLGSLLFLNHFITSIKK